MESLNTNTATYCQDNNNILYISFCDALLANCQRFQKNFLSGRQKKVNILLPFTGLLPTFSTDTLNIVKSIQNALLLSDLYKGLQHLRTSFLLVF